MNLKKHRLFRSLCIVFCAMLVVIGGYLLLFRENRTTYTYEELNAMPADELLNLFLENGLIINERLKETFTEKELQDLFKSEFPNLHQGFIVRSDMMYFDLAKRTKEIYDKITK